MKKTVFILALTALMAGMLSMTAFAHGHGRGHKAVRQQPVYGVCTADNCAVAGYHQHGDTWYCGSAGAQGNYAEGSYAVCTADGCTLPGLHEHDGTYYYCANHNTGHGHGQRR